MDLAPLRLRARELNCLCTQLGRGPRVDIACEGRLGAPLPQEFYQAVVYTRGDLARCAAPPHGVRADICRAVLRRPQAL